MHLEIRQGFAGPSLHVRIAAAGGFASEKRDGFFVIGDHRVNIRAVEFRARKPV
jgi:hypothetical protein